MSATWHNSFGTGGNSESMESEWSLPPLISDKKSHTPTAGYGSAAKALELLASPRFAQRPAAHSAEVQQRINELRNDWGDR